MIKTGKPAGYGSKGVAPPMMSAPHFDAFKIVERYLFDLFQEP